MGGGLEVSFMELTHSSEDDEEACWAPVDDWSSFAQ